MKLVLLAAFLPLMLAENIALAQAPTIIKNSNSGGAIEFYTTLSGTVSKKATISSAGVLQVDSITNVAGTGQPVGGVPPGAVMAFAMPSCPTGWLLADGSAVSATTYTNLATALTTTWGTSSGTVVLPDLRGVFLKGQGTVTIPRTNSIGTDTTGKDSQGNYYGTTGKTPSLIGGYYSDKFQSHWHKWVRVSIAVASGAAYGADQANTPSAYGGYDEGKVFAPTTDTASATGAPRTGYSTEPQSAAVTYCIKY